MSSACLAFTLSSLLAAGVAQAQTNWVLYSQDDRRAVSNALEVLNMTMADPGFTKDLAEPRWTLARMRTLLGDPLAVHWAPPACSTCSRDGTESLAHGWIVIVVPFSRSPSR